MSNDDDQRIRFERLANVIYHLRCAAMALKSKMMVKTHLDYAEASCVQFIEELGLHVGTTAEEADQLKFALMNTKLRGRPALPPPKRIPSNISPLEELLLEAATNSGSNDEFRELGRLQIFCMRARFPGAVEEDPDLPVRPWIVSRGHESLVDLREAARLFNQWSLETFEIFRRKQQGVET